MAEAGNSSRAMSDTSGDDVSLYFWEEGTFCKLRQGQLPRDGAREPMHPPVLRLFEEFLLVINDVFPHSIREMVVVTASHNWFLN